MSMDLQGFAEALTLGVHLLSAHIPAHGAQNNINPGIYARDESSGWEAGVYYNTYKRPTVYVGKHWKLGVGATLFLGGATGYDRSCETAPDRVTTTRKTLSNGATVTETYRTPMRICNGSSKWPVAPMAGLTWAPSGPSVPRIWFAPALSKDSSSVLHLSWEFK